MADIDVACVGDACPRFDGGRVAAAALLPTSGGGGRGTGVSTPEPARQYTWKAGAQLPLAPLAGMARRAIARRSARRRGGTVKAAASPGERERAEECVSEGRLDDGGSRDGGGRMANEIARGSAAGA